MSKGKTTNALMKHIRDNHNIEIQGSKDKLDLMNMGYFHGYKGYRFLKKANNRLNITNFDEIVAIYNFDSEMKSLFYPLMMQIETAYKNRTIEVVVSNNSPYFESIYDTKLNYHDDYLIPTQHSILTLRQDVINNRLNILRKNRLIARKKYHADMEHYYNKDDILFTHYINRNIEVPIWAYFENMTLGNLAYFISNLNIESKIELAKSLQLTSLINTSSNSFTFDHYHYMITKILFEIKDLRNAIAHNSIIFDCRFKTTTLHNNVISSINRELNMNNILTFETITDYFVLSILLLKGLKITKRNLSSITNQFENIVFELQEHLSQSDFDKIIDNKWKEKIKKLRIYLNY